MPNRSVGQLVKNQTLYTATAEMSVAEAAAIMSAARVGALLVLQGGKLAGIFTERDALNRVLAVSRDAKKTHLSEVMTPDPLTVSSDMPFRSALFLMQDRGFRHVPVIDAKGTPIGIVSVRDALGPEMEEIEAAKGEHERIAEILG